MICLRHSLRAEAHGDARFNITWQTTKSERSPSLLTGWFKNRSIDGKNEDTAKAITRWKSR